MDLMNVSNKDTPAALQCATCLYPQRERQENLPVIISELGVKSVLCCKKTGVTHSLECNAAIYRLALHSRCQQRLSSPHFSGVRSVTLEPLTDYTSHVLHRTPPQ